ncbi:MAG: hypothetical protein ACXV9Q_05220 [Chthoniobacterales bacterium]
MSSENLRSSQLRFLPNESKKQVSSQANKRELVARKKEIAMTRSILVFALGLSIALPSVARANPNPSPTPRGRKFVTHLDQTSVRRFPATSPSPSPKYQGISGQTQVGGAATSAPRTNADTASKPKDHSRGPTAVGPGATGSSRLGDADTIPSPASSKVIVAPRSGSERVYVPGGYSEPYPPAAGPGFRSSGSSAASYKTKSQSDASDSTAARKAKILIPSLAKHSSAGETKAETNFDADPPTANELGAPVVIPTIPRYDAVPRSKALFLPDGNVPVPVDYTPPAADAPVQISPTALRAWNGEMTRETRTFDQTRVQVTTGADGARRWQFFWRTSGAKPRAARWEVSTAPFVDDASTFPPPGLIAYGDASVNAPSPTMENFFAVEFNSLAKNFGDAAAPGQLYLRVVPVDANGNAAAQPSNWIRLDIR